jgi:hypothetical protein
MGPVLDLSSRWKDDWAGRPTFLGGLWPPLKLTEEMDHAQGQNISFNSSLSVIKNYKANSHKNLEGKE